MLICWDSQKLWCALWYLCYLGYFRYFGNFRNFRNFDLFDLFDLFELFDIFDLWPIYGLDYIKTTHCISTKFYSSSPDNLIHGPGQGSPIGPALWVLLSCLMFAAMDIKCRGAEFCNPTQTVSHSRTGNSFVDDVANVVNFVYRKKQLCGWCHKCSQLCI